MKNLLLAFALISILPSRAFSQDADSTIWIYAQMVGTQKLLSQKVDVSIDFGQGLSVWRDNRMVDTETGKPKTFNSMVDGLNFMGTLGWEFVQAYTLTVGNQNVYHWLIRRAVRIGEKGEYIPLNRSEYKQMQKSKD